MGFFVRLSDSNLEFSILKTTKLVVDEQREFTHTASLVAAGHLELDPTYPILFSTDVVNPDPNPPQLTCSKHFTRTNGCVKVVVYLDRVAPAAIVASSARPASPVGGGSGKMRNIRVNPGM